MEETTLLILICLSNRDLTLTDMSTLLYGGSFNPITVAHISCATAALSSKEFKEVVFIPCGDAPHKKHLIPFIHRLAMVKRATSDYVGFNFSAIEGIWASDGKKSYSIDTYRYFKESIGENVWWLIGADNVTQLDKWYDLPSIRREMRFAVVPRPGYVDLFESSNILTSLGISHKLIGMTLSDISSTKVREKIASGSDCSDLVPERALEYIKMEKLYER